MKRSRPGQRGLSGRTFRTPAYRTATMSAMERHEPTCELPPWLVIRTTCCRRRRANSTVSRAAGVGLRSLPLGEGWSRQAPVSSAIELSNHSADVLYVVVGDHHVHGQHDTPLEQAFGNRKAP